MVKPPFMEIACPVCSKPVKTLEYYPRSLCPDQVALYPSYWESAAPVYRRKRPGGQTGQSPVQNIRDRASEDNILKPTPNSSGITLLGGFYGYYANTGLQETYSSSTCYVDGITCEAKNARFGGIVIEAL